MKKWLYLAALLATCYLNLVYDWPEGRTILVVELVFPAVLYLEAKLMSVRIKIRPHGRFTDGRRGGDVCISPLWWKIAERFGFRFCGSGWERTGRLCGI